MKRFQEKKLPHGYYFEYDSGYSRSKALQLEAPIPLQRGESLSFLCLRGPTKYSGRILAKPNIDGLLDGRRGYCEANDPEAGVWIVNPAPV